LIVGLDKRVVVALTAIGLVLTPAAVLRALCVGHSCDDPTEVGADVPFCSLPEARRDAIAAGFREGRSPDVLVVPHEQPSDRVPLAFMGRGIDPAGSVPSGTKLDTVAPTIAEAIGIERPHPEVRSGEPIDSLTRGERPRVVVVIALVGIGSDDVSRDRWDALRDMGDQGVMSTDAVVGSAPNDRAAVTTTLGTGGLPYQHGITGTFVRNDHGEVVPAWGRGAPVSVIASLPDDMDELHNQEPHMGLVAASPRDSGLIGGNWYLDNDMDDIVIQPSPWKAAAAVRDLLADGFGTDRVTDLLAVSLDGPLPELDRAVAAIVASARAASKGGALIAVSGTGSTAASEERIRQEVERTLPGRTRFVERFVAGGFFLDQEALARTGTGAQAVVNAILETEAFADAFAAINVEFARYC
jgi:hypothetical protein